MIKGSPSIVAQLNNLTEAEAQAALGAVGKSGSNLARAMSKLNHNSRAFLALLKRVGGRIPGSPTEKLAQRSKALAAPIVFGSCTIMANICPAEINQSKEINSGSTSPPTKEDPAPRGRQFVMTFYDTLEAKRRQPDPYFITSFSLNIS